MNSSQTSPLHLKCCWSPQIVFNFHCLPASSQSLSCFQSMKGKVTCYWLEENILFCKGMRGSSFYATHNTLNIVLHRTGAAKSRLVAESKCWPDLDFCYKWHGVFDGREEPGIAKKQPEFKKWGELAFQGGNTGLADPLLHGRRGSALPTNRHQVHKYTWTFSTS